MHKTPAIYNPPEPGTPPPSNPLLADAERREAKGAAPVPHFTSGRAGGGVTPDFASALAGAQIARNES